MRTSVSQPLKLGRVHLFAILFVLCGWTTQAATIDGKAIRVADGDSITILDISKTQHRIRIDGIDAPEKAQPFGDRSRQNMVGMVASKDVRAECHKTDRYGRQVCKVWVQPSDCPKCGKTLDVGHAHILAGIRSGLEERAGMLDAHIQMQIDHARGK